jgi:predicted ATPase
MENFIIISGGPGGGKTTLIDALAMLGHGRTIEAGRFIIQAQAEIGGTGVHFGDQALFAELMLMHEIRNYREALAAPGLVFFDRGIPELVGYLPMVGRPLPKHFKRAAELYRYNGTVFLTPPWREIFANDAERKQDWAEAARSYELCGAAYREQGYDAVDLPKASVKERVRFVLDRVGNQR